MFPFTKQQCDEFANAIRTPVANERRVSGQISAKQVQGVLYVYFRGTPVAGDNVAAED
jgi:hypothetical protein